MNQLGPHLVLLNSQACPVSFLVYLPSLVFALNIFKMLGKLIQLAWEIASLEYGGYKNEQYFFLQLKPCFVVKAGKQKTFWTTLKTPRWSKFFLSPQRSPWSHTLAVGYPWITVPRGGCTLLLLRCGHIHLSRGMHWAILFHKSWNLSWLVVHICVGNGLCNKCKCLSRLVSVVFVVQLLPTNVLFHCWRCGKVVQRQCNWLQYLVCRLRFSTTVK